MLKVPTLEGLRMKYLLFLLAAVCLSVPALADTVVVTQNGLTTFPGNPG